MAMELRDEFISTLRDIFDLLDEACSQPQNTMDTEELLDEFISTLRNIFDLLDEACSQSQITMDTDELAHCPQLSVGSLDEVQISSPPSFCDYVSICH
jgi:hypothetical protein